MFIYGRLLGLCPPTLRVLLGMAGWRVITFTNPADLRRVKIASRAGGEPGPQWGVGQGWGCWAELSPLLAAA